MGMPMFKALIVLVQDVWFEYSFWSKIISMNYQEILDFWFKEIEQKMWWQKSSEFDQLIVDRFGALHKKAQQSELWHWRENAKGRLAEIIVLDQFSRNIFRNSPLAFFNDNMALSLAQEAVRIGADEKLDNTEKAFLYMPYMHSESLVIHEEALIVFSKKGLEGNLDFEKKHKTIIDRFGRYPHRNKVLDRQSTAEELEFLKQPNSSF
jgi:uncharacterized protein (DUF924 family)